MSASLVRALRQRGPTHNHTPRQLLSPAISQLFAILAAAGAGTDLQAVGEKLTSTSVRPGPLTSSSDMERRTLKVGL